MAKRKTAALSPEDAERLAKAKAVLGAFDIVHDWPSDPDDSSSGSVYHLLQHSDGKLTCDCKGWTNRRRANPSRECKHQNAKVEALRLLGKKTEIREVGDDAYMYVIEKDRGF